MIIAGLISGTSADALDAVLVRFETAGENELRLEILDQREVAFGDELKSDVLRLLEPEPVALSLVADVDAGLGQLSAEAVQTMLDAAQIECDLVVSHGQTIQHLLDGGRVVSTVQVGQPAWIAERTGCPVLSDVRAADVAAGGQGAPLASTLDTLLLADTGAPTAALNLGGIANITVVQPDTGPIAYDTGPANALIDVMARRITASADAVDRDGEFAARGRVVPELLTDLLADPYYSLPAPKSTGKELFHAAYLDEVLAQHPRLDPYDVIATVTRLSAVTVADECRAHGVTQVFASGGGTRNPTLMAALADELGGGVRLGTTDELGLPADAKEAVLMALLGWLSWHGLPGTIPSCTGADWPAVAGRITPGRRVLALPAARNRAPRKLSMITHDPSEGVQ